MAYGKKKNNKKAQICRPFLLPRLLLTLSLPQEAESLRSWENNTKAYHVAEDPIWIPLVSYLTGPLIPLPDMQPAIIHGYRDYFFSKPPEDWLAFQPMFQGGYGNGLFATVCHTLEENLCELEQWGRDAIEFVVGFFRLFYCTLMTINLYGHLDLRSGSGSMIDFLTPPSMSGRWFGVLSASLSPSSMRSITWRRLSTISISKSTSSM